MQAMPTKLRAAVVLAAWGTLRRGEVLGLRRDDVDLAAGTVRVERSLGERRNGAVIVGPPKSGAGMRTVHMPAGAMQVLVDHLNSFVSPAVDAPLFVGRTGLPLRPQGLEEAWRSAREEVGLPALRFHDLRHFAGTMAAAAGASTKEVMARGGWSSPQMALRYEHATRDRDRFIAHALEALSQPVAQGPDRPLVTAEDRGDRARSRTQRARRPSDEDDAIQETNPDQDVSATRVRPSGFEPETCGLRVRSHPCLGVSGDICTLLTRPFADRLVPVSCSWRADIWGGYGMTDPTEQRILRNLLGVTPPVNTEALDAPSP